MKLAANKVYVDSNVVITLRLSGRKYRLPDAIHIVSTVQAGCSMFLTSDTRLAGGLPLSMRHVSPDEAGLALIEAAILG